MDHEIFGRGRTIEKRQRPGSERFVLFSGFNSLIGIVYNKTVKLNVVAGSSFQQKRTQSLLAGGAFAKKKKKKKAV